MPLTNADGSLTVQAVQFAFTSGLVDKETALKLLPLDIENPSEVIRKADKEQAERDEEFDRRQEALIAGGRRDQDQEEDEDHSDEEGIDQ